NGYGRNDTQALLYNGGTNTPVYQILIAQGDSAGTLKGIMTDPANTTGDPAYNGSTAVKATALTAADFAANPTVPTFVKTTNNGGTSYQGAVGSNEGFYVVGPLSAVYPNNSPPNPGLPVTLTTSNMTWSIGTTPGDLKFTGTHDTGTVLPWPTIV